MIDHQILAEIQFFSLHDEEDRKALAEVVDGFELKQGSRLFETGDRGDELYIVRSGKVEIFIRNVAGEKIVLTVAEKGDLFGELSMLDSLPRTATAVAPLSPRARPGAPVSMPLNWNQVKADLDSQRFTMNTAPALLKKSKPWQDYCDGERPLKQAIERLVTRK